MMLVLLGALVEFVTIVDKSISFWTTIGESMSSMVLWMMTVIVKMLSLSLSLLVKTVAVSTPDRTSSSLVAACMSAAVSMAGCVSLSSMAETFVSTASSMFKWALSLSLAMTMSVGASGRFEAVMRCSMSHLIQMWLASMVVLGCASQRRSSCALSEGVDVESIGSL